ncbi:hypothetical protein Y032_0681g1483 [Ancylostoma ceylanicum]|uniref:Uncharacterized protein n=1 Tax=Ancylostoma ceylanicum TaxID=53326 RepID=A0A016WIC3_9BILA|nr:hypothetical protein Y032_0681g1483 [Ancylostoma ceylanicum]
MPDTWAERRHDRVLPNSSEPRPFLSTYTIHPAKGAARDGKPESSLYKLEEEQAFSTNSVFRYEARTKAMKTHKNMKKIHSGPHLNRCRRMRAVYVGAHTASHSRSFGVNLEVTLPSG